MERVANAVFSQRSHHVPLLRSSKNELTINLADYAKDYEGYRLLIDTWEELALDEPNYLGSAEVVIVNDHLGKARKALVRSNGPHLDPCLMAAYGTNVPKVESRWLIKKLFTTVEGGLYYKFRGIPDTLDDFLVKFAGMTKPDKGKVTDILNQVRSDQKSAILFSRVTAKPRAVLIFHALGGRTGNNQGLVMITQDVNDENGLAQSDPLKSLLDNKPDAFEVIAELPNGEHVFALFNGQGKRQDSVPDNIAHDTTVKEPFTSKLQPGISCVRCHAPGFGIQTVGNDVLKLKLTPVTDVNQQLAGKDPADTLDRALGLFSGDFEDDYLPIQRARDDYKRQMVYTGSRYGIVDPDKLNNALKQNYSSYAYDLVGQDTAIREIRSLTGYKIPFGATLDEILVSNPPDKDFFGKEDPYVKAVRNDLKITRNKFEQILVPMISRIKKEFH